MKFFEKINDFFLMIYVKLQCAAVLHDEARKKAKAEKDEKMFQDIWAQYGPAIQEASDKAMKELEESGKLDELVAKSEPKKPKPEAAKLVTTYVDVGAAELTYLLKDGREFTNTYLGRASTTWSKEFPEVIHIGDLVSRIINKQFREGVFIKDQNTNTYHRVEDVQEIKSKLRPEMVEVEAYENCYLPAPFDYLKANNIDSNVDKWRQM